MPGAAPRFPDRAIGALTGLIFLDIHLAYESLAAGRPAESPPIGGYRDYSVRQQEKIAAMTLDSPEIQDWIAFASDTGGQWPSFPLPLGDTHSSAAGSFMMVELLDADQTEDFDTACRLAGARFSGGVLACAGLAEHHLTGTHSHHGFTPSDTRSLDADAMSVGWFASLFPVSVPVAGSVPFAAPPPPMKAAWYVISFGTNPPTGLFFPRFIGQLLR